MACMDRRPSTTGFPEDLTDEICENPAEQSESELSDSSPPTPDSIPTGPSAILEDELSDIDNFNTAREVQRANRRELDGWIWHR